MKTKYTNIIVIGIILLAIIIGIYFYPILPDSMASHWNEKGVVNGYMPKFWGIFFMPILLIGLFLLFRFLPRFDPLKRNIDDFMGYYNIFIIIFTLFMFYIYLLTLFFNIFESTENMFTFFAPAFAILFFYLGILIENAKRNWFIGIRNPWTLSSDYVWNKTHKMGGILFKIIAILSLIGVFLPNLAIWFVFLPIIIVTVWVMIYSYLIYKKENKNKK